MKKQDYHCSITAHVTPREALDKIARVSEWWAKNFEGHAQKLNDVFTVRFGDTFVTFKISEFIPDKKIVWQVIDCYLHWIEDKTEWNGTKVVWEISSHNNEIQIDMTHIGLTPDVECYDNCKPGWDSHIKGSLFKLLNEGKGSPA